MGVQKKGHVKKSSGFLAASTLTYSCNHRGVIIISRICWH
jgi:hypothetical protein